MKSAEGMSRRDFLTKFPIYFVKILRMAASDDPAKPPEPGGVKVAKLNVARCLAWEGISCQHCYLACPLREQAIRIEDQKPVIAPSLCDGCAQCVAACQTVNDPPAIKMVVASLSESPL